MVTAGVVAAEQNSLADIGIERNGRVDARAGAVNGCELVPVASLPHPGVAERRSGAIIAVVTRPRMAPEENHLMMDGVIGHGAGVAR